MVPPIFEPSPPPKAVQEPTSGQLTLECLRSLFKEFCKPLKTNDPQSDFYAFYRRESKEFDREYIDKYDRDLSTSLIFAGILSSVASTFITSIRPELKPDSNAMTATYMQILVHHADSSLFPDVNVSSVAWAGPPKEIVNVLVILYSSLAFSFLAAFLAIVGKQYLSRYARNRGSSDQEKSLDRQKKLDGFEGWYFGFVIECIPLILQLALLFLWCATPIYLWKTSRTISWLIVSFTVLGVTLGITFRLLAWLCRCFPYHVPFSVLLQATKERYRSLMNMKSLRAMPSAEIEIRVLNWIIEAGLDTPILTREQIERMKGEQVERMKGDVRCISWILDSAKDGDGIFCTAQFAMDIVSHPDIAKLIPLQTLQNHLLACSVDGRVNPTKLENVNVIGLAIAAAISMQLCINPEREDIEFLSHTLRYDIFSISASEPTFLPGLAILKVVLQPSHAVKYDSFKNWRILAQMPGDLPTSYKRCLSRTMLQTLWRWRQVPDQNATFNLQAINLFCERMMANGGRDVPALKIECLLIMSICLGDRIGDISDLFFPNIISELEYPIIRLHYRLKTSIKDKAIDGSALRSVLSGVVHLDPFRTLKTGDWGFEWYTAILYSERPSEELYPMAKEVVELLAHYYRSDGYAENFLLSTRSIVTEILSTFPRPPPDLTPAPLGPTPATSGPILAIPDLVPAILPLLTLLLPSTNPLDLRPRALEFIIEHMPLLSRSPGVLDADIDIDLEGILEAIGDPFEPPAEYHRYDPMKVVAALIGLYMQDRWRDYLRESNFRGCERRLFLKPAEEETLKSALKATAEVWPEFRVTRQRVDQTIDRLRELGCLNTARVFSTWADGVPWTE